jgi:cyclin B
VYITDNAYEQADILELEYEVLRTLEFNVTSPSAFRFLERFAKLVEADSQVFNLAWYLIELPLIEYKMLKYRPSMISSAAHFVAMKILKRDFKWNEKMGNLTACTAKPLNSSSPINEGGVVTYSEQTLRPCAKDL